MGCAVLLLAATNILRGANVGVISGLLRPNFIGPVSAIDERIRLTIAAIIALFRLTHGAFRLLRLDAARHGLSWVGANQKIGCDVNAAKSDLNHAELNLTLSPGVGKGSPWPDTQ
jgi:hypothetical protein